MGFAVRPAAAQADNEKENVTVIISARGAASCRPPHARFRGFEKRVQMMQDLMQGKVLSLTGCEVWSIPKDEVDAFKQASAGSNVDIAVLGQDWNQAFREAAQDFPLSGGQQEIIDAIKAAKSTVSVRLLTGPPPALLEYVLTRDEANREPARIVVTLGDGSRRSVVRTSVELRSDRAVWRGQVEETGGAVTLMWWPTGKIAGTIHSGDYHYSIRHLGEALYAVVKMSRDRMPSDHAPMPRRMRHIDPNLRDDPLVNQGDTSLLRRALRTRVNGENAPPRPSLSLEQGSETPNHKQVVIDVMVAYTAMVKKHYLDVRRELIELAIEEANESFRFSNLKHISLRLAHAYETDYVEQGEHFDHLYRMVDLGDGHMEDIHDLRDMHSADVVLLLIDDAKGCGLATRVYAAASEAFAVVHHECAATNHSLAHEIGHLIGARHELALDPNRFPFPYGHGYVNGTKWRDIMSSKSSCGGCERVPVWSNPEVLVRGERAGDADSNNARVLLGEAARVAAFRESGKAPAGLVGRSPTGPSAPAADQ
jgi:hypothetical protein